MATWKSAALLLAIAAGSFGWIARPAPAHAVAPQEGGAPPGPSDQHKALARYVGNWDAEMEMAPPGEGMPAEVSKAKATCKLGLGGLWLVTDFEGSLMGGPFLGHEVTGYDPITKKYVLSWFDSMTPTATTGTGEYDAATKTMHTWMSGKDAMGAPSDFHGTDVWTDDDHRTWTMWMKGPDGKEFAALTIRYARRK